MRRHVVALFLSLWTVACGGSVEDGAVEAWGSHPAALVTPTTEDVVVARLPASTGAGYGYGEYLPPGYLTSTTHYPVVIHLNGNGEFGTSTTEADLLNVVTRNGALKNIRYTSQGKTYFGQRGVMVFTPRAATSWQPAELDAFVTFLVANYRVDTTRIYMTGLSFGGYGSWKYAYTYGSRLAALAPMASNIGAPGPTITQLLNVPVWAVHSYGDSITYLADRSWLTGVTKNYGVTQQLVVPAPSATLTYLFPAGSSPAWTSQPGVVTSGNARARFTVLPGTNHDCWTQMYDNYAFWDWLLAQQRAVAP